MIVPKYKNGSLTGKGTYGKAYKVFLESDTKNERPYTIKRSDMKYDEAIIKCSILREISLLSEVNCPHIVHPLTSHIFIDQNIDSKDQAIAFLYEYGAVDVYKLRYHFSKKGPMINEVIVKSILFQLLLALDHLHQRGIIHCDVTPSNLIIMPTQYHKPGILKIIDFGLSRTDEYVGQDKSTIIVTISYRSPELLLGDKKYTSAVDIWAAGCIFAELLTNKVLFQAEKQQAQAEATQVKTILSIMGNISEADVPRTCTEINTLMAFNQIQYQPQLKRMFSFLNPNAYSILEAMLQINPNNRITAHDALRHPYFNDKPIPMMNIAKLISPDDWSILETNGARNDPK